MRSHVYKTIINLKIVPVFVCRYKYLLVIEYESFEKRDKGTNQTANMFPRGQTGREKKEAHTHTQIHMLSLSLTHVLTHRLSLTHTDTHMYHTKEIILSN